MLFTRLLEDEALLRLTVGARFAVLAEHDDVCWLVILLIVGAEVCLSCVVHASVQMIC
jgi:hypothetical protein